MDMAEWEERVIERAVAAERALIGAMDAASARPVGLEQRPQRVADELLAQGDAATIQRLRSYGPFLTGEEKAAANRRALRAGQPAAFPPDGGSEE